MEKKPDNVVILDHYRSEVRRGICWNCCEESFGWWVKGDATTFLRCPHCDHFSVDLTSDKCELASEEEFDEEESEED